jgi:hypothetical protein
MKKKYCRILVGNYCEGKLESLRLAYPSSRGVLPSVVYVCVCVISKPERLGGLSPKEGCCATGGKKEAAANEESSVCVHRFN